MVTLTNGEALQALRALHEIAERNVSVPVALKIRRLVRELETTAKDVEALRMEAVRRLGDKDKEGKMIEGANGVVPFTQPGAKAEYLRYYEELLQQPCEAHYTLALAELGKGDIASKLVIGLGPLLIEPSESDDVEV